MKSQEMQVDSSRYGKTHNIQQTRVVRCIVIRGGGSSYKVEGHFNSLIRKSALCSLTVLVGIQLLVALMCNNNVFHTGHQHCFRMLKVCLQKCSLSNIHLLFIGKDFALKLFQNNSSGSLDRYNGCECLGSMHTP